MDAFNRPPRIQQSITKRELSAPTQPNLPPKPGEINWVGIGLPILGFGFAVGLIFILSGSSTARSFVFFIPFMLAGILVPPITNLVQSRKYKRALEKGKTKFNGQVDDFIDLIRVSKAKELTERLALDPEYKNCVEMAKAKDPHLGERRPDNNNPDYLSFRVGLGIQPSLIELKGVRDYQDDDPFASEFRRLRDEKQSNFIDECPITVSLLKIITLGVAGYSPKTYGFCRSVIIHLATNHWPTEVQFVVVCPENHIDDWRWLSDLPHRVGFLDDPVISISSIDKEPLSLLDNEIRHRRDIHSTKPGFQEKLSISDLTLPSLVVVMDHIDNVYEYPALVNVLKGSKDVGIYGVVLCDDEENIPGESGGVFIVDGKRSKYKEVGVEGRIVDPVDADYADASDAESFAKYLSNINWLIPAEVTDPPQMVTLLDLFRVSNVEDLKIQDWWSGQSKYKYMQAPIGRFMPSPEGDLVLDLQDNDLAHGPHGLISGMTGSGKSELLKTLVLSLAITHYPYDLNFVLVDYKGGAAFNDLIELPHVIAVVTDIETNASYAERLILGLSGELKKRMQKLIEANEQHGLKNLHIDDYRSLIAKEPMPRLIILFDEFAEFKDRHPAESDQLISIARRGRSLGIHLILCTQNPAMVVNAQIRQNSKFRICLNVSSPDESRAMIGTPDAWRLPRGRAYFLVDRPVKFQVAYAGKTYLKYKPLQIPENAIYEINADKSKSLIFPTDKDFSRDVPDEGKVCVDYIRNVMKSLKLKNPERLLPEPLSEQIFLPDLISELDFKGWNGSEWEEADPLFRQPVLGKIDQPFYHDQPIYRFKPQVGSGHLLLFGSSGSGKSTVLRTIATSIATLNSPLQARIYILNLGQDPGWEIFRDLIHVEAIVDRDEREKGDRLLLMLRKTMFDRFELFREIQSDDLVKFNELTTAQQLPEIYLLIDGLSERILQSWVELVDTISEMIRVCRSAGIYFVISANTFRDIPAAIFSGVEDRISFRQVDRNQLETIVGAAPEGALRNEVGSPSPPGRGLMRGDPVQNFQAALPGYGKTPEEQARFLKTLFNEMRTKLKFEIHKADFEPLARHYYFGQGGIIEMPSPEGGVRHTPIESGVSIGVRYDNKSSINIDIRLDGPTFLIASQNPRLGKTTSMKSWVLALAENYECDEVQFVFLDFHSREFSAFRQLPHTLEYVRFKSGVMDVLDKVKKTMVQRQSFLEVEFKKKPESFDDLALLSKFPIICIVIDDFDGFRGRLGLDTKVYPKLAECLIEGEDLGLRLLIAENLGLIASPTSDVVLKRVVRHGSGLLLGGPENMSSFYNNASLPRNQQKTGLPEGRGYLIKRGQVNLLQSAVYWTDHDKSEQNLKDRIALVQMKKKKCAEWPSEISKES